jgi:hypothetical protein
MANDSVARVARLRVPLGFAFGVFVWWLARPTVHTLIAGGAVACVGEALRIWAAGHLIKSREVTSSGPYQWFAHPLYVGSSVMGLGLAIGSNRLIVALLVAVYLGVTIAAAIKAEEAFLRRAFGDEYEAYRCGSAASAVARGVGAVSGAGAVVGAGAVRRFALARALTNHEQRAVVGLLLAMLLLALKLFQNI